MDGPAFPNTLGVRLDHVANYTEGRSANGFLIDVNVLLLHTLIQIAIRRKGVEKRFRVFVCDHLITFTYVTV